jgi:hypothetical protein
MCDTQDHHGADDTIQRTIQTAALMAQLEVPVLQSLPAETITRHVIARIDTLQKLGGVTLQEAQGLKAQVDGTDAGATPPPLLEPDGHVSLAGLIGRRLPDRNVDIPVSAGLYVIATAEIGGAVVGFAVCGTACAVVGATTAALVAAASLEPPS